MNSQSQVAKSVMIVAAHPDDVEMACGGTIAKLVAGGASVNLLLLTSGECGGRRNQLTAAEMATLREAEQLNAAAVLGIRSVEFLREPDADVQYSTALRGKIVRWIRTWRPEVLFTHDPRKLFLEWNEVNHRDHRVTGELAIDAVYPYARGRLLYPEHSGDELKPHAVSELFLWDAETVNQIEDVSGYMDARINAVASHQSQFPKMEAVGEWLRAHSSKLASKTEFQYAECFHRVNLRPVF